MMIRTLRTVAALPCTIFISVVLTSYTALADGCPCFDNNDIDEWFLETTQFEDPSKRKFLCVDEPSFVTFDYLDRSAPRSLYLDVKFATSNTGAKCSADPTPTLIEFREWSGNISAAEAADCRREILRSQAWAQLQCPNN